MGLVTESEPASVLLCRSKIREPSYHLFRPESLSDFTCQQIEACTENVLALTTDPLMGTVIQGSLSGVQADGEEIRRRGNSRDKDSIAVAAARINDQLNVPVVSAIQPAVAGESVEPMPRRKVHSPTTAPANFFGKKSEAHAA